MSRIAVIGAGAWGTGLAIVMGRGGNHQVRLWAHEKEVRDSISARRVNELVPSRPVHPGIPSRLPAFAGSPGWRRNCGQRDAFAALPSSVAADAAPPEACDALRERDQGAGRSHAFADDRSGVSGHRIRQGFCASDWSAQRTRHSPKKLRAAILQLSPWPRRIRAGGNCAARIQ